MSMTAPLIAGLLSVGMGSPIAEGVIELRGRVPAVCTLSSSTGIQENGVMTASLAVFCNQREGSSVIGTLVGGDPAGYMISNGRESLQVQVGSAFDVASYADAHSGFEQLTVTPLSADQAQQPLLMFDIRADG